METETLPQIPEESPPTANNFGKVLESIIILNVYTYEPGATGKKPRRVQLFRSKYQDLATLQQSLVASSIQTANVLVKCEDYMNITGRFFRTNTNE